MFKKKKCAEERDREWAYLQAKISGMQDRIFSLEKENEKVKNERDALKLKYAYILDKYVSNLDTKMRRSEDDGQR